MSTMTTKEIRKKLESGDPTQIEMIDPEDLEIFKENEEERNMITMDGIRSLYNGICEQAVLDYKKAHVYNIMRKKELETMPVKMPVKTKTDVDMEKLEIESDKFMGSDFFKMVSGCRNKEKLLSAIEKTIIEERKKKLQLAMI